LELFRPLERALASLQELPRLPDTTAGNVASAIWFRQHPKDADLDALINLLGNDAPLVRAAAIEALAATFNIHERWSDTAFSLSARQEVQLANEHETSPVVAYQLRRLLGQLPKAGRSRRRTPLKIVTNPYLAGLPISRREHFFGRQQLLDDIRRVLVGREAKSIVLYGARRSGKTSVLYRLRDGFLGDSFLPVYLDMQALAGATQRDFLQALLTEMAQAVRDQAPESLMELDYSAAGDVEFRAMQRFLGTVLPRMTGMSVVLLIDEYEVLEQFLIDANLGRQFQNLLEHEDRFFVVFAGSRKLESLKNPNFLFLLDLSKQFRISFLKQEEAIRLITDPSAGRLEFESAVIDRILKLTGGHPFYTQLLCQIIFERLDGEGVVALNHLEGSVRQFIENPAAHLILTWNGLTIDQRVVASAMAKEDSDNAPTPNAIVRSLKKEKYPMGMRPGEVEQELALLTQIDWVKKDFGKATYSFTMDLVRRWIKEQHSVSALAEEYRDQVVSQVASFWRQKVGWLADIGLLGILGLGVALLAGFQRWNEQLGWSVYASIAALYLIVSIPSASSTPGLRLAHLRVVRTSARPIGWFQGILYGLLLTLRLFLLLVVLHGVFDRGLSWSVSLVIFLCLMSVDNLMILFSKRHQGLYDKLMRTFIVPAKAVRE
jgi:uncharacterized RDD family membrane protein YckC